MIDPLPLFRRFGHWNAARLTYHRDGVIGIPAFSYQEAGGEHATPPNPLAAMNDNILTRR